jgi:hypothetical protein
MSQLRRAASLEPLRDEDCAAEIARPLEFRRDSRCHRLYSALDGPNPQLMYEQIIASDPRTTTSQSGVRRDNAESVCSHIPVLVVHFYAQTRLRTRPPGREYGQPYVSIFRRLCSEVVNDSRPFAAKYSASAPLQGCGGLRGSAP